jgi:signal transduction histidine kinase
MNNLSSKWKLKLSNKTVTCKSIDTQMSKQPFSLLKYTLLIAGVVVSYYIAARIGLILSFKATNVSPVWPPSGIALIAVLLLGYRVWPGILLGALISNIVVFVGNDAGSAGVIASASSCIAIGNTIEAITGAFLFRRLIGPNNSLGRTKNVLLFLAVSMFMCLTSSTIGSLSLCITGLAPWAILRTIWFTWWIGDIAGVLVLVLAFLGWPRRTPIVFSRTKVFELITLTALLTLTSLLVFGYLSSTFSFTTPAYLLIPFLMWAAIRFDQREASLAMVLVSAVATYGTVSGNGAFANMGSLNASLVTLQGFICILSVTIFFLATSLSERNQAIKTTEATNQQLRANEQQLRAANKQLQANDQQLRAANQQLRANEQQREGLVKTLKFKNKELQDIVYITSHDLRSPLVNILGFGGELAENCKDLAGLLAEQSNGIDKSKELDGIIKNEIPESLRFITSSAGKMSNLLDGLLQISRVGTVEINHESIDMSNLIGEVLAGVEHKIKENSITVTVDPLVNCIADADMLHNIFTNLVGNAIKYFDPKRPGEITISAEVKNGMSVYCVSDNGMGIEKDYQEKVFDLFHRLNPDDVVGGEGLGLTIVTRTLNRLDGNIRVESEFGKGSKFFISLPTKS